MRLFRRLKDVVVHRILGVSDTPHRIAWGVFLGFLIGWTPTIGFQIVIYVAVAAAARANKVSGIPILFISNPFSAVPLYYFAWWVGALTLGGGTVREPEGQADVQGRLQEANTADTDWATELLTAEFWESLGQTLWAMGAELWLGSLIMGVATGIPGYFVTLWAVRTYRERRS